MLYSGGLCEISDKLYCLFVLYSGGLCEISDKLYCLFVLYSGGLCEISDKLYCLCCTVGDCVGYLTSCTVCVVQWGTV